MTNSKKNNNKHSKFYVQFLKTKLNIKVKSASKDKTQTKEKKLYFKRKDMEPVHNKAR